MKSVEIAELENGLLEHLRAVEHGHEVLVTDRNRPIARIVPVGAVMGCMALVPPQLPFSAVRGRTWRAGGWSARWDELLAQDRGDR